MKQANWSYFFLAAACMNLMLVADGLHNAHAGWTQAILFQVLGCTFGMSLAFYWFWGTRITEDTKKAKPSGCVDIWALQKHMMLISGQSLPMLPEINKHTLMYYALILEEASELGKKGLVAATLGRSLDPANYENITLAINLISYISNSMQRTSEDIRKALTLVSDDWRVVPPLAAFKEILDGAVDVNVVTAGFALAAGLPGREGFVEGNTSNASKANPATGLIDKTVDGKWIKGVNYVAPDMMAVLEEHVRRHREVLTTGEDPRFMHKSSYET